MIISYMEMNIQEMYDDKLDYFEEWKENECVVCGESYNETTQTIDEVQVISFLPTFQERVPGLR